MKLDILEPNIRTKAWVDFTVDCHKKGMDPDHVYFSKATSEAIVRKMTELIFTPEPTVVIEPASNGELFEKQTEYTEELTVDWLGWKEYITDARSPWFSDFGYFKALLESNQLESYQHAIDYSKKVGRFVLTIKRSAADNGSFENSLILATGLDIEELNAEYGEAFCKMLKRVFKVGQAQSKQDTMSALKKKALKGDLNACKTILVHEGALKSDKQAGDTGTSGPFQVIIDADDAEL